MRTLRDISIYSLIPLLIEKCDIDYTYEPNYESLQLHLDNGKYLLIEKRPKGMFYRNKFNARPMKVESLIEVIGDYLDGTT